MVVGGQLLRLRAGQDHHVLLQRQDPRRPLRRGLRGAGTRADFIEGREKVEDFGRLAVRFDGIELARGGGGARCMTMPVERENLTS